MGYRNKDRCQTCGRLKKTDDDHNCNQKVDNDEQKRLSCEVFRSACAACISPKTRFPDKVARWKK